MAYPLLVIPCIFFSGLNITQGFETQACPAVCTCIHIRIHVSQGVCLIIKRVWLRACSVAEKLANHNHFLTFNSVSHAALLGREAPAECILSTIPHTLHAPAPGGWVEHQRQGSESILICQYERLDYHWGRLPGPHVREAYNGRESWKEGERNGRVGVWRKAGREIENFQCFCRGKPCRVSCK